MRAGIAIAVGCIACSHRDADPLVTHELPGFTLGLPPGQLSQHPASGYDLGRLDLGAGDSDIFVEWLPAPEPVGDPATFAEAVARAAVRVDDPAAAEREGHAIAPDTYVITAAMATTTATMIRCGGRLISITTVVPPARTALHQRIVGSLVCKPDLARDKHLGATNIQVSLPGMRLQSRQPMILVDDPTAPNVLASISQELRDQVAEIEHGLRRWTWIHDVAMQPAQGDHAEFTAREHNDAPVYGVVRLVHCPAGTTAIKLMAFDREHLAFMMPNVLAAHCTPAGQHDSAWPDTAQALPVVNFAKDEVEIDIVYDAPANTTTGVDNLRYISGKTEPASQTGVEAIDVTDDEHASHLAFLPKALGTLHGFSFRFHLWAGDPRHDLGVDMVKGSNGIVFVADAAPGAAAANTTRLAQLGRALTAAGLDPDAVPIVFELVHTRDPGAVPVDQLRAALAIGDRPAFEVDVKTGAGVFDTLKAVAKAVLARYKDRYSDELMR